MPASPASKEPIFFSRAPVKAPRSCPKSSLSIRFGLMAPQSTTTKGPSFRRERSWSARATSSLPVPVSPTMTTVESTGAMRVMSPKASRIAGLVPTRSPHFALREGSTASSRSPVEKRKTMPPTVRRMPGRRKASRTGTSFT